MTTLLPDGTRMTDEEEQLHSNWQRRGVTIHEPTDIHPTAYLAPGVVVWPFTTICAGVRIGRDTVIGARVYVGREAVIGAECRVNDGSHLTDRMTVGNKVFFGPGVLTSNDRHPRVMNPDYVVDPPTIEDGASIGSGANLLPGVRIGRGSMIAAGAVVHKDVSPGIVVAGNPARPLPCRACDHTHRLDQTHAPAEMLDLVTVGATVSDPGPQAVH